MAREIIIIQCASRKNPNAGFWEHDGKKVIFVAQPKESAEVIYYRPDGTIQGTTRTWRDELKTYNEKYEQTEENRLGLCKAWELYKHEIYGLLVKEYSEKNVFILSAGWGLVRAGYLLPYYDITFKVKREDAYKKREKKDEYADFNQLAEGKIEQSDTIYFFGGKPYLPFYRKLTRELRVKKVIYYKGEEAKEKAGMEKEGYDFMKYKPENPKHQRQKTTWYYQCARDFIAGNVRK